MEAEMVKSGGKIRSTVGILEIIGFTGKWLEGE